MGPIGSKCCADNKEDESIRSKYSNRRTMSDINNIRSTISNSKEKRGGTFNSRASFDEADDKISQLSPNR